jgi:hypothetical protein
MNEREGETKRKAKEAQKAVEENFGESCLGKLRWNAKLLNINKGNESIVCLMTCVGEGTTSLAGS